MRCFKLFYMNHKNQGTMKKNLTQHPARKNNPSSFLRLFAIIMLTVSTLSVITTKAETGDDIKNVKISLPDSKLLRRADREINRNMAIELRNAAFFKINMPETVTADQQVNAAFFNEFTLSNFYEIDQELDQKLSNEFLAFNINTNLSKNSLQADNEMNAIFYNAFKIQILGDVNAADLEMNNQFSQLEN